MIPRWLYMVVVMLCCSLTLATSASAECAWVLWIENTSTKYALNGTVEEKVSWTLLKTTPDMTPCQKAVADEISNGAKFQSSSSELVEVDGNTLRKTRLGEDPSGRTVPTEMRSARYLCLPDTVDPRGPKEK